MESEIIRKELLVAFEYCYLHDDWVNPLSNALEGLTASDALKSYGPESTSIWQIVLHLAAWNENIVERISTGEPVRPVEGHWPALPEVADEPAWVAAKQRLWDSLDLVASTLKFAPIERLSGPPYGVEDIICRFIHMGYHLGQITKMREFWEL